MFGHTPNMDIFPSAQVPRELAGPGSDQALSCGTAKVALSRIVKMHVFRHYGRDAAQLEVLAQLRAEQRDPAHGGRAAQLRGSKNASHQAAVWAWEGDRPDPEVFRTQILPSLPHKPIAELVAATGLSPHYCSLIRLGKKVPHPRHWEALREL